MAETFQASRDASVYRDSPLTNFGSSVDLEVTRVGVDNVRSVLFFDVPPKPGYTVSNATLELYVHDVDNPLSRDLLYSQVHRLAEGWDEDDVSWNEQPDVEGDYLDRLDITSVGWKAWTVTTAVQAWHNGDQPNFGLRVASETGSGDGPRWTAHSSEYTVDDTLIPKLVVTYVAKAPNASTPTSRSNFDATEDADFEWDFEHDDPNVEQESYQVEIMRVSDSVVVYDSTKTTSDNESVTVTGGTLSNGVDYQWRVKTWATDDVEGSWSSYDAFSTQTAPTVTIDDPASDGATISTSTYLLQWTFSHASESQSAYRVQVYDTSDESLIVDSGKVTSTDEQYQIPFLEDDVSARAEVTVFSDSDVASSEATRTFNVNTIPPPTPTVTVTNDSANGRLSVAIDNGTPSGTGESTPDSNDLYRRVSGSSDWELIASDLDVDATYQDYDVPSGSVYEYRVRAWSDVTTYADGTDSSALSLLGVWLHQPDDAAGTVQQFMYDGSDRNETIQQNVEMFRFAGRERMVAQFGEMPVEETISVTLQTPSQDSRDAVKSLAELRKILVYRDGRGRKYHVVIVGFRQTDSNDGGQATLELNFVDSA